MGQYTLENRIGEKEGRLMDNVDLLWTDPTKSLWNTSFKIMFIGAQVYTVYLMLNDYKPTHDPNQDTFKVQYLMAGAAVLAILFPYKYSLAEVCMKRLEGMGDDAVVDKDLTDILGFLDLA